MINEEEIQHVSDLYIKATENNSLTVQPTTQQESAEQATTEVDASAQQAAGEDAASAADTLRKMMMARSILVNENGTVG